MGKGAESCFIVKNAKSAGRILIFPIIISLLSSSCSLSDAEKIAIRKRQLRSHNPRLCRDGVDLIRKLFALTMIDIGGIAT